MWQQHMQWEEHALDADFLNYVENLKYRKSHTPFPEPMLICNNFNLPGYISVKLKSKFKHFHSGDDG